MFHRLSVSLFVFILSTGFSTASRAQPSSASDRNTPTESLVPPDTAPPASSPGEAHLTPTAGAPSATPSVAPSPTESVLVASPPSPPRPVPPSPQERAESPDTQGHGHIGDELGDEGTSPQFLGFSLRLLLQTEYRHTFGVTSRNSNLAYREPEEILARDGDGWALERLTVRLLAKPTRRLTLKLTADFAELARGKPKKSLKQGYLEATLLRRHLHAFAGLMKLPYSIHELDATATYPLIDDGEVNALVSDLGFAGRDLGAQVMLMPLGKPRYLRLFAGAFRGHANDENASPVGAVAGRAETEPLRWLRLGVGMVRHPETTIRPNPFETGGREVLPDPEDPAYPRAETWSKGSAYGADLSLAHAGLSLRAEGLTGARVDHDTRYAARRFAAGWALLAYRFDAGPVELEPAVRGELLDTDTKHAGGLIRQLGLGLGCYLDKEVRVLAEVTQRDVEDQTPVPDQPRPLRAVPYLALDSTRVSAQLQVVY